MNQLTSLTSFSARCLELPLDRFPEFKPYVVPSEYYTHHWQAEIPWPIGDFIDGLRIQTHTGDYGEEFRVDIGSWHEHFGNYSDVENFVFIEEAFSLIDDFINEKIVAVYFWYQSDLCYNHVEDADYSPKDEDWGQDIQKVEVPSWKGTFRKEWLRPK